MPYADFSQASKGGVAQEIKAHTALPGKSAFNGGSRLKIFKGWLKIVTAQLSGFSGIRPWPGAALLVASLAAGMPALGPGQALAQNNEINGTTNADQCGHVYSCPRGSGDVSGETLTIINSGEMIGGAQAYGGYTLDGRAHGNAFIMNGGYLRGGHGYGGYTGNGTADGNRVTISDTGGDGYGGRVEVAIVGGQPSGGDLYGGYSESDGDALNNVVTINNGNIYGSVIGGRVLSGQASGNEVTVSPDGLVQTSVYGGWVEGTGQAANNTVTVSGLAYSGAYGAYVNIGDALENQVTISGGQVTNGWVYGGRVETQGNAIGNRVTIEAGSVIGRQIYGGYVTDGQASQNSVTFEDGWASGEIYGGYSGSGDARLNRVLIGGGFVTNQVYGGYSVQGAASGNQVTIDGGSVTGSVYGGYSEQSVATGNAVTLGGGVISGSVFGGWSLDPGMDVRTGNRLSVSGFQGSLVRLDNFEFYDFYFPSGLRNNDTLITITGNAATDLTGSKVNSLTIDPASSLTVGQQVILIDQVGGNFDTIGLQASQGVWTVYQVFVMKEGDQLIARLDDRRANPQTKALAQGALAGMVLLNQGADLALSQGMDSALNRVMTTESGRPAFFTATSTASSRTETGSHLDSDGWSFLAGLTWKADRADRKGWLAGAYFESGRGSYDGYNSFAGYSRVHSSGDTKYYGGGLMARYQWAGGFRAEAGLRAGRVETDYLGSGYLGGTRAKFDLDSAYYGAHLGLGHERPLSESLTLDLAALYIWTHGNGQKVRVLSDRMEFDDVNSHRLRVGGRLTFEAHPVVAPYAGAWVETEFDGRAASRNLTAQNSHDPLKTRGTTGGGELGLQIKPGGSGNFNLNLGLQGYTGRRDGVGGHLSLAAAF